MTHLELSLFSDPSGGRTLAFTLRRGFAFERSKTTTSMKSLSLILSPVDLAVLHHVRPVTGWLWATTLPPPSLPFTGIFVSSCEEMGQRVPQF